MNGSSQSRHRRRSAAAFSESSWLRLFVIDMPNRKLRRIIHIGQSENMTQKSPSRYVAQSSFLRRRESGSFPKRTHFGAAALSDLSRECVSKRASLMPSNL